MDQFFFAHLKGENEVPPVDTSAYGLVRFISSSQQTKVIFLMEIHNIQRFTDAHIHFGGPGQDGPVITYLFGDEAWGLAEQQGISAQKGSVTGVIMDEDIIKNSAGIQTVSDLVEAMKRGQAYVNAHTEQHPSGEIRGRIQKFHLQ